MSRFLRDARHCGVLPDQQRVHASSITRSRSKISWLFFERIGRQMAQRAYETVPDRACDTWKGMNVFAVDGSKYTLPASDELREHFQPRSGLGKGTSHYPQCLVSTVYDVLRRFPIARTVCPADSSERDEAMAMLRHVPSLVGSSSQTEDIQVTSLLPICIRTTTDISYCVARRPKRFRQLRGS